MLMIGVSTGQNSTNLIPAVQKELQIDRFILLETKFARDAKLSDGITEVLKGRKIKVDTIDLTGIDSHIVKIYNQVLDKIKDETEPIYWNLGGGQKPQQLPLWELFKTRNTGKKIKDIACYANHKPPTIEIWKYNDNNSIEKGSDIPIKVDLTAEEVFKVGGCILFEKNPKLIYKAGQKVNSNQIKDLMKYSEFRELFFKLPIANKINKDPNKPFTLSELQYIFSSSQTQIERIIANKLNIIPTKIFDTPALQVELSKPIRAALFGNSKTFGEVLRFLEKTAQTEYVSFTNQNLISDCNNVTEIPVTSDGLNKLVNLKKSSDYFEKLLSQRIVEILESQQHTIVEAYLNLKIADKKTPKLQKAEYDILCVTDKGRVISLDAKTFEFESKDIDARLFNLSDSAGIFGTFSVVVPMDFEDVDKDFYPKKLIDLILDPNKKRIKFFVVSDSTAQKSFWIKINMGIVEKSKTQPNDFENWVECKPLTDSIFG